MRIRLLALLPVFCFALTGAAAPSQGQSEPDGGANGTQGAGEGQQYSPPVRDQFPTSVFWGDLHLHTNNSPDAYLLGTRTISPDDAYRFAQGTELISSSGVPAKLRRPLDFLAVADHAEFLGVYPRLQRRDPAVLNWDLGRRWADYMADGNFQAIFKEFAQALISSLRHLLGDVQPRPPEALQRVIWKDVIAAADRNNRPGVFTAFPAYEWSSTPNGNNLHRVVIFREGAGLADQTIPLSSLDSENPEDLWRRLDQYEQMSGGKVLAIPHNGNLSNGLLFAPKKFDGSDIDLAYARTRARWEPLAEVTQSKGDSEAHPLLSPTDEFADFEKWDTANIMQSTPKEQWMLKYEYLRPALGEGLRQQQRLGVNPFKLGMIGSSDIHTGLSTTEEDNFFGKFPTSEPHADRTARPMSSGAERNYFWDWQLGASGLAAVWAKENTRAALFDAMRRREVYGTTGSRIMLRFFGGWSYKQSDVLRPDYAAIGYRNGVPMGGDLTSAPKGQSPRFMVLASRDPDEANLDRIQIIKGWVDSKGDTHEKIYDVALSDGRKVNPKTGKAPPVGSTVNIADASYTNSIGDPLLATVWTDPDFDPAIKAFYYVRVLEIPKPRWTAYDAKFFNKKMPANVTMTVQDRAYSSPIWYQP